MKPEVLNPSLAESRAKGPQKIAGINPFHVLIAENMIGSARADPSLSLKTPRALSIKGRVSFPEK